MNWTGVAQGQVTVRAYQTALQHLLLPAISLNEEGQFTLNNRQRPLPFKNTFKLVFHAESIAFYHERFGQEHAVWLFNLIPQAVNCLSSEEVHQCGDDQYLVTVTTMEQNVTMHWKITGPRKNEVLNYQYF